MNKNYTILAIVIAELISTIGARASITVTNTVDNSTYSATQIKALGGAGLGITLGLSDEVSGTRTAKEPSEKCCQTKCYCGSVAKVKARVKRYAVFIAKAQTSYVNNGFTGDITNLTRNEATAHELRHVEINTYAAARAKTLGDELLSDSKTNPYATNATAKVAAKDNLAPFIEASYNYYFGQGAAKSEDLDSKEGAGVEDGIWRIGANAPGLQAIKVKIDALEEDFPEIVDSGTADCQ